MPNCASFQAYQWGMGVLASKAVGVLAVGLAEAVIARFSWFEHEHLHQSADLRRSSEGETDRDQGLTKSPSTK